MDGIQGFKEFLESSTIHGLSYIAGNRRLVRLFWICVVITGFTGAAVMIQQSFSSWADSPISTTIETRPITEIDFPNVTVCPPRNSFTSLIPDLVRSRKMMFDDQKRLELSNSVLDAVFDANYKAKYQEFLEYSQSDGEYLNWYTGLSSINLPYTDYSNSYVKTYKLETASLTGSVSTPFFRKTFDENKFELAIEWKFSIFVPSNLTEGSNLVIDIQYDLALNFGKLIERVTLYWQSPKYDNTTGNYEFRTDTEEELEQRKRTARRTYLASEYSADGKKLV